MTRIEIIQAVKVKLEELSPFDKGLLLLQDNSERPIIDYIDSILDEAADECRLLLPLKMIKGDILLTNVADTVKDGVGIKYLPSDFLRIHTIKHAKWATAVHKALYAEHQNYNLQKNRYARGKYEKPIVVVEDEGNSIGSSKALYLYSVDTISLEKRLYVKRKAAELCEDVVMPYIILLAAIKVSNIFGRDNASKALQGEFENKLQLANQ